MSTTGISDDIIKVFNDVFETDININTRLEDISIDSITFINIIVTLETIFNFEFDDEMLLITKFPTIKSMIEYVELKVATNYENS